MMEFVSWDDDSQLNGKDHPFMFQTTNQSINGSFSLCQIIAGYFPPVGILPFPKGGRFEAGPSFPVEAARRPDGSCDTKAAFWACHGMPSSYFMRVVSINNDWLVVLAITILKNLGVRQWVLDDIPYMKWNIIQMFETTNQMRIEWDFNMV